MRRARGGGGRSDAFCALISLNVGRVRAIYKYSLTSDMLDLQMLSGVI
jgi:hypothetical protein